MDAEWITLPSIADFRGPSSVRCFHFAPHLTFVRLVLLIYFPIFPQFF